MADEDVFPGQALLAGLKNGTRHASPTSTNRGKAIGLVREYLRVQPKDEGAPMSAVHLNGHGQVVDDFSGVTHVGLQQHGGCTGGPANLGLVAEIDALVPALQKILFVIARQGLGDMRMVGRQIPVFVRLKENISEAVDFQVSSKQPDKCR